MVTETPTANQLRRRAARLQFKAGDSSYMMLAAQRLDMPEDFLAEAAKTVRQLMVAEMERHPPTGHDGQSVRLSSVGMLLAALGYVPEAMSAEESLYGLKTVSDYERQRAAFARGF